uniref:Uncharacterized protein n=1 Tax=Leersia perrieri TaxID=77586 RepID=A0A0D9WSG8_9ORYZ
MRDLARRHGPVMILRLGEVPTLVVSYPDAAREVMKTHDMACASSPPRLRTGARAVEMRAALSALVLESTARAVLGERCENHDAFVRELNRSTYTWPSSRLAARLSSALREGEEGLDLVFGVLDRIIQEHLEKTSTDCVNGAAPREDFLDVPLRIHREGGMPCSLDMDAIKYVIIWPQRYAGNDAVVAVAELLRNPKVMLKATMEVSDLADPAELEMTEMFGVNLSRKADLLLRPVLHVPVPGV